MEKLADIGKFENLQNQANRAITNKGYIQREYLTTREAGPERYIDKRTGKTGYLPKTVETPEYYKFSDFNFHNINELKELYNVLATYNKLVGEGKITKQEALKQIQEAYGLSSSGITAIREVVASMRAARP